MLKLVQVCYKIQLKKWIERYLFVKKKFLQTALLLTLSASLVACGKEEPVSTNTETQSSEVESQISETETEVAEDVAPEGMYRSELTNEWIDEDLQNQRPVAIMVDNESIALPHYGLTEADIVYEMMNSTANGRITRLMCIVKDWDSIEQFGSIRSVRPTNLMIAPEWDAVVIHDGGPVYVDGYYTKPYLDHISGGFARIDNGKSREYTEYVTTGEIADRMDSENISTEYTEYYEGAHFTFANENAPVDLGSADDSIDATEIAFPFPHNDSCLSYDAETELYYYSEYGKAHVDPLHDNAQLCFKNVLIQCCPFLQYDEHGYMGFYAVSSGNPGYYVTNGEAIPVTWSKTSETSPTKYFDADGNEITINTGKTYIALVPDDDWEDLVIE